MPIRIWPPEKSVGAAKLYQAHILGGIEWALGLKKVFHKNQGLS
jgi:hypothetical protein